MKHNFLKYFTLIFLFSLIFYTYVLATTAQYTYDNLNRLIKVQYDNGTVIQYTYDAVGNRLTQGVQAFSGAAASSEIGETVSASVSLATPAPVSSTSKAAAPGSAVSGAATGPAWFALLTKIRLAGSNLELGNLQAEIRDFLDQGAFSPEEKDRYQKMASQEVEDRAGFIHRTTAGGGERAGTGSPAGTPRKKDAVTAPQRNKIMKDKEKIYTSGPETEMEKPQP
jgi:YD repeat-containing protein